MTDSSLEEIHLQLAELYRTEASLEHADPEDLDAQDKLAATQRAIHALHLQENKFFIDESQRRYRKSFQKERSNA